MATKATPSKPKAKASADAAAEASGAKDTLTVTFRGQDFELPRAAFSSPAFGLALSSGKYNDITYALLAAVGPTATGRFLAICTPDDTMMSVAGEFIEAVSAVAGQGNS